MNKILKTAVFGSIVFVALSGAAFAQAGGANRDGMPAGADRYRDVAPDSSFDASPSFFGAGPMAGRGSTAFPNETDESGFGRGSENPQLGGG